MRGNAKAHEFDRAVDLADVLRRLEQDPGQWTPIAGGTELMVAHAAGRLNAAKLINLWGLPELHFLNASDETLSIGAGVTFGQLRRDPVVLSDFPLLARASTWIGAIANQNRATIAGNIVNGSPAADAPPALLVYDAEIELISLRGKRRIPYADFHLGYKRNVLQLDELVFALHLPRRFSQHSQYLRKVGTRKAMAITKVALAGTSIVTDHGITEIRLAAASVADRPVRLLQTEEVLLGQTLSPLLFQRARTCLLEEVKPIDDIRSTADYRCYVAANLLDEFLDSLSANTKLGDQMNSALAAWNTLSPADAINQLTHCCASRRWAEAVAANRPFDNELALFNAADHIWERMAEPDWMEAFHAHPRIGEKKVQASEQSQFWSCQEQGSADQAEAAIKQAMAEGNLRYEERFGLTYIVCATGKTLPEMLSILHTRLEHDRATELREAAEQQRQITQIRLRKWLNP